MNTQFLRFVLNKTLNAGVLKHLLNIKVHTVVVLVTELARAVESRE